MEWISEQDLKKILARASDEDVTEQAEKQRRYELELQIKMPRNLRNWSCVIDILFTWKKPTGILPKGMPIQIHGYSDYFMQGTRYTLPLATAIQQAKDRVLLEFCCLRNVHFRHYDFDDIVEKSQMRIIVHRHYDLLISKMALTEGINFFPMFEQAISNIMKQLEESK